MIGGCKEDPDFPNHVSPGFQKSCHGPKSDCSNQEVCVIGLLRRGVRYTQYHTVVVSLEKSKECKVCMKSRMLL